MIGTKKHQKRQSNLVDSFLTKWPYYLLRYHDLIAGSVVLLILYIKFSTWLFCILFFWWMLLGGGLTFSVEAAIGTRYWNSENTGKYRQHSPSECLMTILFLNAFFLLVKIPFCFHSHRVHHKKHPCFHIIYFSFSF